MCFGHAEEELITGAVGGVCIPRAEKRWKLSRQHSFLRWQKVGLVTADKGQFLAAV